MNRHTPPDTTETQGHTQQAPLDSLLDHLISISSQLIDSSTNALASTINSRECLSTLSKIENVLDRSIRIRQRDLTRKLNSIESHQLELDKIQDQLHSLCQASNLAHPSNSNRSSSIQSHHQTTSQAQPTPESTTIRPTNSSRHQSPPSAQTIPPSYSTTTPDSHSNTPHPSPSSSQSFSSPSVPASTLLRTPSSIDASQSGTSIAPSPPPPNNLHHQLEPAPSDNHHPP
ncbi:hypothetical protein PtB15_5B401 [Puccinia triticina]|nr:hypothetical protein PtB15_5B401 [Puccinia triticina]